MRCQVNDDLSSWQSPATGLVSRDPTTKPRTPWRLTRPVFQFFDFPRHSFHLSNAKRWSELRLSGTAFDKWVTHVDLPLRYGKQLAGAPFFRAHVVRIFNVCSWKRQMRRLLVCVAEERASPGRNLCRSWSGKCVRRKRLPSVLRASGQKEAKRSKRSLPCRIRCTGCDLGLSARRPCTSACITGIPALQAQSGVMLAEHGHERRPGRI